MMCLLFQFWRRAENGQKSMVVRGSLDCLESPHERYLTKAILFSLFFFLQVKKLAPKTLSFPPTFICFAAQTLPKFLVSLA